MRVSATTTLGVAFCLLVTLHYVESRPKEQSRRKHGRYYQRRASRKTKSDKPNIVVVMTDDQDSLLGSMDYMPKTMSLLQDFGATMKNAFVSTPMCCPSRSSFLTGMYVHNHNVYTNNDNCSSPQWQMTHERRNFATYLSNVGYRTGYFGKYLNEYNGSYIPPGWREWVGLIKNSRFYNYSVNFNGRITKHKDNYYKDYLTDLIANDSVTFLKVSKQIYPQKPVMMVLAMPAPHGPEDSAPQYQHLFENVTSHRTPSWNYAPNPDKQWLLQHTGKMEPIHIEFTDLLYRKRLQTLQSVDDAVYKVVKELDNLGELDNTYILYTSDHGYHLGQFGLVKGKAMPYEFDVRVPLYIRGPGIRPKSVISEMVQMIDLAPTILDMAGIAAPEQMDGESFLKLLQNGGRNEAVDLPWRDTILLERGKITARKIKIREKMEAMKNNIGFVSKDNRVMSDCSKPEFQVPCKPYQKWFCHHDQITGKYRMTKCRNIQKDRHHIKKKNCICPPKTQKAINKREKRIQKKFLLSHINYPHKFKPRFIRNKRSEYLDNVSAQLSHYEGKLGRIRTRRSFASDYDDPFAFPLSIEEYNYVKKCRVLLNDTVVCTKDIYVDVNTWKKHKQSLDKLIEHYKQQIDKLKEIRKYLKHSRPTDQQTGGLADVTMETSETMTTETTPMTTRQPIRLGSRDRGRPRNNNKAKTGLMITDNKSVISSDQQQVCRCNTPLRSDYLLRDRVGRKLSADDPLIYKVRRRKTNRHQRNQERKKRKKRKKLKKKDCNKTMMNCFTQNNNHWKTPPLWNLGPFCFCPNANNNTYWCVRTINKKDNFLYCEFITGFISYYDMNKDPHQLRNAVHDLEYATLQHIHEILNTLRKCKGAKDCTVRYSSTNTSTSTRQQNIKKGRKRKLKRQNKERRQHKTTKKQTSANNNGQEVTFEQTWRAANPTVEYMTLNFEPGSGDIGVGE